MSIDSLEGFVREVAEVFEVSQAWIVGEGPLGYGALELLVLNPSRGSQERRRRAGELPRVRVIREA